MKKMIFLTIVSLFVISSAFAGITNPQLAWSATVGGFTGNPSGGDYNYATGHFLICDYAALNVRIASGTNGALTGGTLVSPASGDLGGLGIFQICVTKSGVIYGGTNTPESTGPHGVQQDNLFRWASETATPTTQAAVEMGFPRAMDVIGTGANTKIVVAGNDAPYSAKILTTTDGINFAFADETLTADAGATANEQIKQGVAFGNTDGTIIYGTKADGAGQAVKLIKSSGAWIADPTYVVDITTDGTPSPMGYAQGMNVVFLAATALITPDTAGDRIRFLDGTTGTEIGYLNSGQDIGTYGYGKFNINETAGTAYFMARSITASSAVMGKVTFTPYVAPTPTPAASAANPATWGLYE